MANIGYLQVVRHCNHLCGFCSNPTTPYTHDFDSMRVLVDDFVARDYFGIILTGGEPTLHPDLPRIAEYASASGLHVRLITNGSRLAQPDFAKALADAGVQLAHVSIYSVRPDVEAQLRGTAGTLPAAYAALDNAAKYGIEVNVNCVINKLNAGHLDENVRVLTHRHPQIRHFVWNNLDPSMGRAEVNQATFTPRLADFELSLHRAMRFLHRGGRTFRVEKVPLCYMTDFAWASTETRKIVKEEERIVHFLDDKQTVRQTEWGHVYTKACDACTLRSICGGLFDRGDGYDPAELHPVFVPLQPIVEHVLGDGTDPSQEPLSFSQWKRRFTRAERPAGASRPQRDASLIPVGRVTERGERLYASKRAAEQRRAASQGISMEKPREDDG